MTYVSGIGREIPHRWAARTTPGIPPSPPVPPLLLRRAETTRRDILLYHLKHRRPLHRCLINHSYRSGVSFSFSSCLPASCFSWYRTWMSRGSIRLISAIDTIHREEYLNIRKRVHPLLMSNMRNSFTGELRSFGNRHRQQNYLLSMTWNLLWCLHNYNSDYILTSTMTVYLSLYLLTLLPYTFYNSCVKVILFDLIHSTFS